LSAIGSSPSDWAITGSDVAITVESVFSMNSAQATIRGRSLARCKAEGFRSEAIPPLYRAAI
jgi:hypothetical protein